MMRSPDFEVMFYNWMGRTPWLLVACAGIVFCMVFFGKQPRRCVLIGSALFIMLTMSTAGPFITPLLLNTGNITEMHSRILLNGLMYSIPNAVALGLLLWAAFEPIWRGGVRTAENA